MAKTAISKKNNLVGVDQSLEPKVPSAARQIYNGRWDLGAGGWIFDRGWEPYFQTWGLSLTDTLLDSNTLFNPIRRIFNWNKKSGESYLIQKDSTGELAVFEGNPGTITTGLPLKTRIANRTPAGAEDWDEQFIPFGPFLFIINGKDKPIRMQNPSRVTPAFFTKETPSPNALTNSFAPLVTPWPPVPGDTTAVNIDKSTGAGLGALAEVDVTDKPSTYQYRVSFISETGSESPVSAPIQISWTSSQEFRTGIFIEDLPVGPPGTVARRLYRTADLGDGFDGAQQLFYFVKQINDNTTKNYFDITPDSQLLSPAPTDIVSISSAWRVGESWLRRMWLAGSEEEPNRIIYSDIGLPEQFRESSYFELSAEGGFITGLKAWGGALFVFRERAINIILPSTQGNATFSATTLTTEIGTVATNTIRSVPGKGLMFLTTKGVYAISGQAPNFKISFYSDVIQEELAKINTSLLTRASACWSQKEREYWVVYPAEGKVRPNRGMVWHADLDQWSFRSDPAKQLGETPSIGAFEINDLTTLRNGSFVIAPETRFIPAGLTGQFYFLGPHVWSAKNAWGNKWSVNVNSGESTYTITEISEQERGWSLWESVEQDLGETSQKKSFNSVITDAIYRGHRDVFMDWSDEGSRQYGAEINRYLARATDIFTTSEDPVMGAFDLSQDRSKILLGTSSWIWGRNGPVRWDIQTTQVVSASFRFYSKSDWGLYKWQLLFIPGPKNNLWGGTY